MNLSLNGRDDDDDYWYRCLKVPKRSTEVWRVHQMSLLNPQNNVHKYGSWENMSAGFSALWLIWPIWPPSAPPVPPSLPQSLPHPSRQTPPRPPTRTPCLEGEPAKVKVKVKVLSRDHMNLHGNDPLLGPLLLSLRDLTLQVSPPTIIAMHYVAMAWNKRFPSFDK